MDPTEDFDRAYANSAFIPGSDRFPDLWRAHSAAFRAKARAQLDVHYGPGERQRLDLFLPQGTPKGLMVFVHGGYWLETGRADWSHLATGAVARGWACALPGYTLAPQARIAQITAQVAQAVAHASAMVPGPVVVTGHSAGGHLAARIGNLGAERLARVVPISPLSELSPLMRTTMPLHLTPQDCADESPARHPRKCPAHIWVGAQERPAFLWQARTLSEAWDCPWTVEPGQHHFSVTNGLMQPDSPLMRVILDGL
jgi:arylformamidase